MVETLPSMEEMQALLQAQPATVVTSTSTVVTATTQVQYPGPTSVATLISQQAKRLAVLVLVAK
jgi:hypothetical protein